MELAQTAVKSSSLSRVLYMLSPLVSLETQVHKGRPTSGNKGSEFKTGHVVLAIEIEQFHCEIEPNK